NVAPLPAILGLPAAGGEGTTLYLTSSVFDPCVTDTFRYAWRVTKNGHDYASGSDPALAFTPDDNGTYVVTLTVTDDDGGSGADQQTINIVNVAPEDLGIGGP